MTLLERATQLQGNLNALTELDQRRTEIEKLEARRRELEDSHKALKETLSTVKAYRAALIPTQIDVKALQELRERTQAVAKAFDASSVAETLTSGRRWVMLLAAIKKRVDELENSCNTAWQTFVRQECIAEPPQVIRQKLAPTPENEATLMRYGESYNLLQQRTDRPPRTPEELGRVKDALHAIREVRATFRFDCPEDVAAFLRSAQSAAGASLDSLTQNIMSWLEKNRMLNQFSVRARR